MKTDTLNVSGMTCGGCTAKVTRALSSVPGVEKVDVSLPKKTAEITFDEKRVSVESMGAALRSVGYDVATTPGATAPSGCSCGK
jgi:copper chaperone